MKNPFRLFASLALIEGLAALAALLRVPSEAGGLLGYTAARLVVALVVLAGIGLSAFLLWLCLRWTPGMDRFAGRLDAGLLRAGRLFWTSAALVFIILLCVLVYLFTYLVFPPHLRGVILWAGLVSGQALAILVWHFSASYRSHDFWLPLRVLPRWSNLDRAQRRVFWLLALVGALYFLAFIIPNALDARTLNEVMQKSGDEYITYPYVMWMLTPANTAAKAIYHWFIYEDYHYGYPFYFLSALALLPVRVVSGPGFADHVQLNLLVLRQMVNVLPMALSALLLTYLQTRLRSLAASIGLFVFLLFIPQVVTYNIRFWHPDALVVLMVVLTLFFLDKDHFRYRLNFALAAVACGLAAGIKLYGFFFFLAVGGYLAAGMIIRCLSLRQAAGRGMLFVGVMAATMLLANPWLFVPQARQRAAEIMQVKNSEITYGYGEKNAADFYRRGVGPNLDFLEGRYGSRWFLLFLAGSIVAAGLWGSERGVARLVGAWFVPMAVFFIYFMSYKSYHYWLPAMLPFFSGALGLAQVVARLEPAFSRRRIFPYLASAVITLVVLVLVIQFTANLLACAPEWSQWLRWKEITL